MTDFFVIRHGESIGNSEGYFTGSLDVHLTELGRKQAELLGEYLSEQNIECVYSSDLTRAVETANAIAVRHGLSVKKSLNLREIYGGVWEGLAFDEIHQKYPEEYGVWLNDKGRATCTGGESVKALAERVQREFRKIASENDGKNVVIVSHGTPIRALNCLWNGSDISKMQTVGWVANASITEVKYDAENDHSEMIRYNFTEHLKELVTSLPKNV